MGIETCTRIENKTYKDEKLVDNIDNMSPFEKHIKNIGSVKANLKQKSDEWIFARSNHITASDVAKIIAYISGDSYYGNIHSWVNDKLGIEKITFNKFVKEIMKQGEIAEENFQNGPLQSHKMINGCGLNFKHSEILIKDKWLLASYDSIAYKNNVPVAAIEIKYSTRDGPRRKCYANYTDWAYYQLCAQMYCLGVKIGMLFVIHGEKENVVEGYYIKSNGEIYNNFLSHIDEIKRIYNDICVNKINPFTENMSKKKFNKLTDLYIEKSKKIAKLKEELEFIRNEIFDMVETGEYSIALNETTKDCVEWKISEYVKTNKILKEGILEKDVFNISKTKFKRLVKVKL